MQFDKSKPNPQNNGVKNSEIVVVPRAKVEKKRVVIFNGLLLRRLANSYQLKTTCRNNGQETTELLNIPETQALKIKPDPAVVGQPIQIHVSEWWYKQTFHCDPPEPAPEPPTQPVVGWPLSGWLYSKKDLLIKHSAAAAYRGFCKKHPEVALNFEEFVQGATLCEVKFRPEKTPARAKHKRLPYNDRLKQVCWTFCACLESLEKIMNLPAGTIGKDNNARRVLLQLFKGEKVNVDSPNSEHEV
jgi:hypothetical protein